MEGIQAALSKSYAGIPGVAWAGIIALGAWLILPHLRGNSAAKPQTGVAATGQATTDYSLGYAQGLQAAGAGANNKPGTTRKPQPLDVIYVPDGSAATIRAACAAHGGRTYSNALHGCIVSAEWATQDFTSGIIPVIIGPDPNATGGAGQTGVGGPMRSKSIGSRSAVLMSPEHPAIKTRVRYAHLVRAVGGPAQHAQEVARVAAQTGVHPARLRMLNPHHTGLIRVA